MADKTILVTFLVLSLIHWHTKEIFLSCFGFVSWFWMFRGCWIKNWTQFLIIHVKIFATSQFLLKNGKNAIQTLRLPPSNDCHSKENIFNTFNTMPRSGTCSLFTQNATPRSGTSCNSLRRSPSHVPERPTVGGVRALQTIVAINVTRRARHCDIACSASCFS